MNCIFHGRIKRTNIEEATAAGASLAPLSSNQTRTMNTSIELTEFVSPISVPGLNTLHLLLCVFAFFTAGLASPAFGAPVTPPGGARQVDLGGRWNFRFDTDGAGEAAEWYATNVPGNWHVIQVPGSFNDQFPKMDAYAGKAWYRRQFQSTAKPGEHAFLHLEGVVLRNKVWVNGRLAGQGNLAFTPMDYDITDYLYTGEKENLLVIETDNKVLPKAIPDLHWTGWQNTGGVIWPVSLTIRPAMYTTSHITTTMVLDKWRADMQIVVYGGSAATSGQVDVSILDGSEMVWKKVMKARTTGDEAAFNISATLRNIIPWSPETPHLYHLVVFSRPGLAHLAFSDDTTFGFRQIEARGSHLLLNGKPLLLRGINRHSFYPGVGMTVPREQTLQDFANIKALGANFVRLAHYSQPKETYEECDRLGLLVWTEVPVWQTDANVLLDPNIWTDYLQPMLQASVKEHWNHPSVIIWSVANEIPSDKASVAAVVAREIGYVKALDPSRLVTFASDKREHDVSFSPVDLIAINEYYGWYYGVDSDLGPVLDLLHERYPDKPIFVSEYGAESISGWQRTDQKSRDFSYEHQGRFLQSHLEQIYSPSRRDFMAGGAPWLYNDFPLPFPRGQDFVDGGPKINAKGLVTQDRTRKLSWSVVQEFYKKLEQGDTDLGSR